MKKAVFKTNEAVAKNNKCGKSRLSRVNFFTYIGIVAFAVVLTVVACSAGGSSQSGRWEYKMVNFNYSSYDIEKNTSTLNDLGAEGWELVSSSSSPGAHSSQIMFTLKRRLP